jgi:hypothetical protein
MKKKKSSLSINQRIAHDLPLHETWRSIQERYHCGKDRISKVAKFMEINNGDYLQETKAVQKKSEIQTFKIKFS